MKIDDPTKFTFGENDKNEITEEDNYLKGFSLKNNVVGDYSENENANTNFHFKEPNSFDKKIEYVPIRCTIFQRDQKDRKYNSNMNENPPNKINYKRNLFMEKTNSYTFKGFKATNEDFRQCLSECIKEIKSIDTKLDLILSQQKKVIQMEEKLVESQSIIINNLVHPMKNDS